MAVDGVITQTAKDLQGNTYTTAVSNDALSNDDFMRLLLEQMKMQDPTKPMDSKELMDSTMQMSTIQANMDMSQGMKNLTASYQNSALSTAANLIGKTIEDGTIGSNGLKQKYKVETIESSDGSLYASAREYTIEDGNEILGDSTVIPLENIQKVS